MPTHPAPGRRSSPPRAAYSSAPVRPSPPVRHAPARATTARRRAGVPHTRTTTRGIPAVPDSSHHAGMVRAGSEGPRCGYCWRLVVMQVLGALNDATGTQAGLAAAPSCIEISTVAVLLRWDPATIAPLRYDVHVSEDAAFSAGRSITTMNASVVVDDLLPGYKYHFAVRSQSSTSPFAWGSLSPSTACATKPLAQTQAHVLPPIAPPSHGSVVVRLGHPEWLADGAWTVSRWELQWRHASSSDEWTAVPALTVLTSQWTIELSGLPSSSTLEVRAIARLLRRGIGDVRQAGIPSDPVLYRTADPVADPTTMLRMSELCTKNCSIDFISNHDSGSAEGDQLFATLMATMPTPNPMGVDFNSSVTTRYCVYRDASRPFANYASCDGPTPELYECVCNDMMDHCFGRLPCADPKPGHTRSGGQNASCPQCSDCTAEVLAKSLRYVGRMAIYLPMFDIPSNPVGDKTRDYLLNHSSQRHQAIVVYDIP